MAEAEDNKIENRRIGNHRIGKSGAKMVIADLYLLHFTNASPHPIFARSNYGLPGHF